MSPTLRQRTTALGARLKAAVRDLPWVVGRGRVLRHWLLSARHAQIALVIVLLAGLFAMPPARDAVLGWIFPKRINTRFFGMVKSRRRNRALRPARKVFNTLYWGSSISWVLIALLLKLPAARRWGEEHEGEEGPTGEAASRDSASLGMAQTIAASTGGVTMPSAVSAAARMGSLLAGRYLLEEELGRGGMGIVYRAHDQLLQRSLALKALPQQMLQSAELQQRFLQEARALAQLTHPHIVQVFDLLLIEGAHWMVMELVKGGTLAEQHAAGGVPPERLLVLARQMAEALAYSHAQGVVHRDFKPANVLLTHEGAVKVMDFGLAKLLAKDSGLTQSGALLGSPTYMSPEQAAGKETGAATDIYSLGITLYELIGGEPPFEGDLSQILAQHITQAPRPLRELTAAPEALAALVMQMLNKEPAARPTSMAEVAERLAALG